MLVAEKRQSKRRQLTEDSDIGTVMIRFLVNERLPVSILESVYLNDLVEGLL